MSTFLAAPPWVWFCSINQTFDWFCLSGFQTVYLDWGMAFALTWMYCSNLFLFVALQCISCPDETFTRSTSECRADVEWSEGFHTSRAKWAQEDLGSLRNTWLHWLLPQWDSNGRRLDLICHHNLPYISGNTANKGTFLNHFQCFKMCVCMYFQNKGQDDNTFDEENLVICVLDLFVAGSETTSTTLRWAFLYMAKYPEIQGKSIDQAWKALCFY